MGLPGFTKEEAGVSGENTGVAPDGGVGVASGAGTSALATRADKTAAPARLAPLRNLRRPIGALSLDMSDSP